MKTQKTQINNLVTCAKYAELVGVSRAWIDYLTRQKDCIVPTMIGRYRFIDITKYPPKEFKSKKHDLIR